MAVKYYSAGYLLKNGVMNDQGENLGRIEEFMIDVDTGRIEYGVLAFGGFPNRTKLFAVPWELLSFSTHDRKFILNIPRSLVEKGAGYDSLEQVMEKADTYWLGEIYEYYSHKPEWEQKREEERQEELKRLQARRDEARGSLHKEEVPK
ncbi:MAG: PRC-barrel domain-containing protein [Dehalococcoidales bacterium]|jgi:sporulation protein YlmC with PRC-barrel domain|nr:PRC-barrel domain-containing protein [Dehalococcoidales bacterium]